LGGLTCGDALVQVGATQPACCKAGVMNLSQISVPDSVFLFKGWAALKLNLLRHGNKNRWN
jgi:hypothetical protein